MRNKKGQSTLEFVVLATLILAALLTMQIYVKRGIQGRWKSAVDDIGDQYDPRISNSVVNETLVTNSLTNIFVTGSGESASTMRRDQVDSRETRNESMVTAGE